MSVKDLFIGGTVYRNIAWYTKGVKEFTRSAHSYLKRHTQCNIMQSAKSKVTALCCCAFLIGYTVWDGIC